MANKSHQPDEKTRKLVEQMSSYGIPQKEIAKVVGIADKTLSKHYRHELDTAETKANAMVAGQLYKKCMNGDTTSIIFWLKTRAKWSEQTKIDLSNDDGSMKPETYVFYLPRDGRNPEIEERLMTDGKENRD